MYFVLQKIALVVREMQSVISLFGRRVCPNIDSFFVAQFGKLIERRRAFPYRVLVG
jgi:hypothetical protein